MSTVLMLLFIVAAICCVLTIPFGIPGSWVLIAGAVLIEVGDTAMWGAETTFSWPILGVAFLIAGLGEALEVGAAAIGAKKGGGSKRTAIGAVVGGIGGALAFTPFFPILGTIVGGLLGTFLGATIVELARTDEKRSVGQALKTALWATLAALAGTGMKTFLGAAVAFLLVLGMLSPLV